MDDNQPTIGEMRDFVSSANRPFETLDGGQAVIVPQGHHLEKLRPIDKPLGARISRRLTMVEAGSFIAYINRFKNDLTQIFASEKAASCVAFVDYDTPEGKPSQASHVVGLALRKSREWERWTAIDGELLPQVKFAEFVEENLPDIHAPDGASLLETVSALQAIKKVEFESGIRLQDGQTQLVYRETIEGGGKGDVRVPNELSLGIPVYFKGQVYKIKAFLRYRITETGLYFKIDLQRADEIASAAFDGVLEEITKGVDITPYHGSVV